MSTSVTLAEVLQAKGGPLEEEQIWALLLLGAECLLEDLHKGSSSITVCPWSLLLSAEGTISFRDNVPQADTGPFRAPEKFCERSKSEHYGLTKMLIYSLGMTLYWSADYLVPPNQPLQLSEQLHSLLLTLCEDLAHKRPSLESILETCEAHRQQTTAQDPANVFIQRLAQCALGSVREEEEGVLEGDVPVPLSQSDAIRRRLREKVEESSALPSPLNVQQGKMPQQPWDLNLSDSKAHSSYKPLITRSASAMDGIQSGGQKGSSHSFPGLASSSTCSLFPKDYSSTPAPSRHLFKRKEKFPGPEFILRSSEPPVVLQLPGSVTTKKGKSFLSQRAVNVILPNGQCLEVKCDIKSKMRAVFETVVAYAKLAEHFYFALAYMRGKEFFFLDDDTKLYKVAPEGWSDQPKKKTSIINFTLFLRIKFFVDNVGLLQHGLTRHLFYLQLRQDLLEEHLHCPDEIVLQLGALALQVEMGNYTPEARYRVEHYIPASRIEKMGLDHLRRELTKLHQGTQSLLEEQAELEFLKVTQQLPEYGVVFHHVFQEKKMAGGVWMLGICAKGIIMYEIKNNTRVVSQRFQWRDTERISAHKKKFMIESSFTGRKHTFLTDSTKTCKYLLDLCSAQHKFNAQMNSEQLLQTSSEDCRFMEISRSNSAYASQQDGLALSQRLSHSENVLYGTNLGSMSSGITSKSCDDNFSTEASTKDGEKSNLGRTSQSETHINVSEKQSNYDYLSIDSTQNTAAAPSSPGNPRRNSLIRQEREIICVTLKRDPKNGFGFVIIGGENVGKLDLGIFIASIVPGGPADRAGHMKPGGRLISVNNSSLEGVSFNTAVKLIQNSSEEVELIISQPKDSSEERPDDDKRLPIPVSSTHGSELCSANGERPVSEACHPTPATEGCNTDHEFKNSMVKSVSRISARSADSLELQDGNSHSQLHEESSERSAHGSPGKDEDIKEEDCLLNEDGVSLQGTTQKRSGQVLARGGRVPAQLSPGNSREKCMSPPLAGGNPKSYSFATDENTFEVHLKKNSGGLGFSFVQTETDACQDFGRNVVRIKRLFPGQPAKENGAINVGDVLLAVNGKAIQGLLYQEVLHLLRGAPPAVTLRLCRPPEGLLPEIDQRTLTPVPSPAKEYMSSQEASGTRLNHKATDKEHSLLVPDSLRPACGQELVEKGPPLGEAQEAGSLPAAPMTRYSYKHLWKSHQEATTAETFLSLEDEVRQGCRSPYELERAQSSSFDELPTELPESLSPTQLDEEYLTIHSASINSLLCGGKPEAGTAAEPHGLGLRPPGVVDRELCTSESEWEDSEDVEEPWNAREIQLCVTLTRSADKGYGFTVVVNKTDDTLYVAEILGDPALSDGRLRRGDRLLSVNGTDAQALSAEETLALLYSSPRELSLVVGRTASESFSSLQPEEIPEITLTKGDGGQLGLKLTGGIGSPQQGISVLEIVPGLPASQEGSLKPHDQIVSICGLWTEGMSLDEAVMICEAASHSVHIRATRNGNPVIPLRTRPSAETVDVVDPPSNETVALQDPHPLHKHTKLLQQDRFPLEHGQSDSAAESYSYSPLQDCITNIELEKPANGSLGFALVGGRNGRAVLIKAISPGSAADIDGRLQVGDILLKVNGHLVSGLTRNTVIDILRKAHGTVQLTVCRSTALQGASLSSLWDESPLQNELALLDGNGGRGVLGAQPHVTLHGLEESGQMNSQGSDVKNASPHECECLESVQEKHSHEKTRLEEDEDEAIAQRFSAMPRGSIIVTEEALKELARIKPTQRRDGLQQQIGILIQNLQQKIEREEMLKEFVDLEHIKPTDDCLIGRAPENREKNRYRDILPYDETRVPIGEWRGYINASYICVRVDQEELFYISAQGPLPSTVDDFWQMVWENHSDVIAMITREMERGTSKCCRYWPEPPNTSLDLLRFHLRLVNYQILDCFIIRKIEITNKRTQGKCTVQHLQFTSWPDHGTPQSTEHLIKFVLYMRKVHKSGPIIVHCSAGIGRSGVLLCVDIVLTYIENDLPFDIKKIVEALRYQRFGMVQTKEQYAFCYEAALAILKDIQNMNPQPQ